MYKKSVTVNFLIYVLKRFLRWYNIEQEDFTRRLKYLNLKVTTLCYNITLICWLTLLEYSVIHSMNAYILSMCVVNSEPIPD